MAAGIVHADIVAQEALASLSGRRQTPEDLQILTDGLLDDLLCHTAGGIYAVWLQMCSTDTVHHLRRKGKPGYLLRIIGIASQHITFSYAIVKPVTEIGWDVGTAAGVDDYFRSSCMIFLRIGPGLSFLRMDPGRSHSLPSKISQTNFQIPLQLQISRYFIAYFSFLSLYIYILP